jgi:colanic acid/amylovoran biosynthesis protein
MKILIENSSYHHQNMGDAAMLQVAVTRLRKLWPDAKIYVLTDEPDLLTRYCPGVRPVGVEGHRIWFKRMLFRPLYRFAPDKFSRYLSWLDKKVQDSWPAASYAWFQVQRKFQNNDSNEGVTAYLKAIFGADFVMATGGGYINDVFPYHMNLILDTLKIAIQFNKPTFMFGQGIGPLQNPKLRTIAEAYLPLVDLISLRESRIGRSCLDSLGVPLTRVITTGDDAIELAYKSRPTKLGTGIGVNLRLAKYSEVNSSMSSMLEVIRVTLLEAARRYGIQLIPLPIAFHSLDSDVKAIRNLLAGYDYTSDKWQSGRDPLFIIQQTSYCRLVVTGSYHAAVFALAQGIPVVALANSTYYAYKFLGLADQFGVGCHVLLLDDKQFREKFMIEIDKAWQSAEQVRPQLLRAAVKQIEMGYSAYQRLYELVTHRRLME